MNKIKEQLISLPPSWNALLKDEIEKDYYQKLVQNVAQEYVDEHVYPPVEQVFRALELTSPSEVKVVIISQDPYHEEGQANGLAFSVSEGIILPPSLVNIYKELNREYNYPIPRHNGVLDPWAKQGVLLLNASLTVREGQANSHAKLGWMTFTDQLISALDKLDQPIVYLLWGNFARSKKKFITNKKHLVIESAHPSPLSAYNGFFKSHPFSKTNQFLIKNNLKPIEW